MRAPLDASVACEPRKQMPDVRLIHRLPRESAEERAPARTPALPAQLEPPADDRDRSRVDTHDAPLGALPPLHHERPRVGSKSFTASASASPIRSPHRQQRAMRARLRTPVGARLEHCRISRSISPGVRRSASSLEPLDLPNRSPFVMPHPDSLRPRAALRRPAGGARTPRWRAPSAPTRRTRQRWPSMSTM